MNLENLCYKVAELARNTGLSIRNERKVFNNSFVELKGHNDLVSHVDRMAEARIVEVLGGLLPEAGFIAEEKTVDKRGDRFEWIIDPLDGTTNFIHGIPIYCVSIGLYEYGRPVLGVVYEANLDENFTAWKGGGAYLNGERLHISPVRRMSESLIATGFPYHKFDRMAPYMEVFDHCMRNTHGLRRLGSAAADLAYVAAGRFEAFYEYGLNPYDVAGGIMIVMEAGGTVTDFSGGDGHLMGDEILATNGHIHEEFLKIISEKFNR